MPLLDSEEMLFGNFYKKIDFTTFIIYYYIKKWTSWFIYRIWKIKLFKKSKNKIIAFFNKSIFDYFEN